MSCRIVPFLLVIALLGAAGCKDDKPTEHPYEIAHRYGVSDPEFGRTMGNLLGPPLIPGNSIKTLRNGDEIFPAMLEAIRSAQKNLNLETYIYWSGTMGAEFADALSERASHGVQVHVILDTLGSATIDPHFIKEMTDVGVQVIKYHPIKWFDLSWTGKFNNRTHRKLLIVDGQTGFTGGIGIAEEWRGHAQDPKHYRDNHYLVRGPVVWQLQAAFVDNWMESTGQVLHGDDYFPQLKEEGNQWAQIFRSSADTGSESMELMYLLSIVAAQKNIRLASAYFVPDELTIKTLIAARQRGVTVQIIVPGKYIDEKVVRPASRARWGKLLKAGVEIYEYQPTMYHVKQMIVDDAWVSIGSANLDNRSFRTNDEANLNALDGTFAAEQIRIFEDDMRHSEQITYEQWLKRPVGQKLTEFLTVFGWMM